MNLLTGTEKIRYQEFGVAPARCGQGRTVIMADQFGSTILEYHTGRGWRKWRTVYLEPGLNHIYIPFNLAALDTRWRLPIRSAA